MQLHKIVDYLYISAPTLLQSSRHVARRPVRENLKISLHIHIVMRAEMRRLLVSASEIIVTAKANFKTLNLHPMPPLCLDHDHSPPFRFVEKSPSLYRRPFESHPVLKLAPSIHLHSPVSASACSNCADSTALVQALVGLDSL